MACSSPSTTTYTVPTVTTIQATECIGNSLNTINANYQSLKTGITTTQNYVNDQLTYLSCLISNTSNFKNKLINAQGLINQRVYVSGTATTGSKQYTLDRWRVVTSGQNLTFSTSQNVVTFNAPVGGVEQVIEGQNIETGNYILSWTGTATATVSGSPITNGGSITLTGGSNVTVKFTNGTFKLPQLEKGTVATAFEYRPIGTELALCQRYYQYYSGNINIQGYTNVGTAMQYTIILPTEMRTAPTISYTLGTSAYVSIYGLVTGGSNNRLYVYANSTLNPGVFSLVFNNTKLDAEL